MKKILVTGGVLFTIMSALASPTMLDLKEVVQSGFSETCEGNDYSGDSVSMQAVYLPVCPAGQYLDTDDASVGSDGKITGAICRLCAMGFYCPGTQNVSIPSGNVSAIGKELCPEGWRNAGTATRQAECGAICPETLDNVALTALHANSATTNSNNGMVTYPTVCGATISVCAAGYTKVDLVSQSSGEYTVCSVDGVVGNGDICNALGFGSFEISGNSGTYAYRGGVACDKAGKCTVSVELDNNTSTLYEQYADYATCASECGVGVIWRTRIADAISREMTKNAPVSAAGGIFCVKNSITID